ncbi:MAG: hypothetical protein WCL02_01245 [bacterium]
MSKIHSILVFIISKQHMRTLIILLVLVIAIVLVVFFMFFKEDSKHIFNLFKRDQKSPDHHHRINTKYFQE